MRDVNWLLGTFYVKKREKFFLFLKGNKLMVNAKKGGRNEGAGISPHRLSEFSRLRRAASVSHWWRRRASRPSLTSSCRLYTLIPGFHKGKGKKKNFKKEKNFGTVICPDVNSVRPSSET